MADLTITEVRVIKWGEQVTRPVASGETIAVGDVVRYDSAAKWTGANGTDGTEANFEGLVAEVDEGIATIAGDRSLVTLGSALDALAYGALVYLSDTDKTLGGAAGDSTATKAVGRVEAVSNQGTTYKALRIMKEVA